MPEPQVVSISEILNQEWNGTERLESKLVKIENIKFIDSGVFTSYRNYKLSDGLNVIDMWLGRADKLEGTQIPRDEITIIGIVNQNKSSIPYQGNYQLMPRFAEDIRVK